MLRRTMLLMFVLLTAGLLVISGCSSSQDPLIGKWTLKGTAAKSEDPATANYVLPSASATAAVTTQEFLADGKYINPRGETSTWERTKGDTVMLGKVEITAKVVGSDLYETIGSRTQHWVKTK